MEPSCNREACNPVFEIVLQMAVIFAPCSNPLGEGLPLIGKKLAERGVNIMAEISLGAKDMKNPDAGGEQLLPAIIGASPQRDLYYRTAGRKTESTKT